MGLKSNVGRFAPLADPRNRSPKIWTWVANCRAAPQQRKGVWRPLAEMSNGTKKPSQILPAARPYYRVSPAPPRNPHRTMGLQHALILQLRFRGGAGEKTRQYGLAIGRIWEGFFFPSDISGGGAQVQILGDLSRGSARGAKRPTFDLRPKFRRRGICFRRRFFVLRANGTASRDLVMWRGGPPFL